ncbi:Cilia- and flagella-associated protein 206 [Caenorhabditis elegans]|uniref:Cilia- and flagella-associated protein 206 n=1 Tax=Caenorhabditis elegans TaxID=6239 RepID=O62345_CAEEL|nr:Cilia- and flagella-associated protein 206 [Caenorhabditis elegans]CAB04649.2 Cilia- and flagella-associated protein 206 [Caenorhabditis elegans]
MSEGLPSPSAGENIALHTIRQVLQYETRPENLDLAKLPRVENITSQYELLKLVYSRSVNLGNTVLDIHMMRHPVAMEKQRLLFNLQPGLLPLLVKITLDKNHPLRALDEYLSIINLIDRNYPTIKATHQEIIKWCNDLDIALLKFLDCSLICAAFSVNLKTESIQDPKLLPRLDPTMFSPVNTLSPSIFKKEISHLGNILVHGAVTADQERFVVEIAKAHQYFLARKITIVKNLESNSKFAIGMYNVVTKLKERPAMFIGYKINGDTTLNIPEVGLDFSNIHPVICVHQKCHLENNCGHLTGDYRYIYIKVNTVHLGDPPLGARNTVNFPAMKLAWALRSQLESEQAPAAVFDPMVVDKQQRKKYRKKKGTNLDYKMIWEEKYLRFVVKEYKMKNGEDERMMEAHLMPEEEISDTQGETKCFKIVGFFLNLLVLNPQRFKIACIQTNYCLKIF